MQSALASLIRPKMIVYDIGANVGFFSMIAARLVGPEGRVVSFEPVQINADQIMHNALLNNFAHVHVRAEALGNENGPASFYTSEIPTLGRFTKFGSPDEFCNETTVTVRQLDALLAETELPPPDLIKMDVEGAEVDVLAGAFQTITRFRPLLLIELHGTNEPIAQALETQEYITHVLGSLDDIRAARWSAHIIARPRERTDLSEIIKVLTIPALTG